MAIKFFRINTERALWNQFIIKKIDGEEIALVKIHSCMYTTICRSFVLSYLINNLKYEWVSWH